MYSHSCGGRDYLRAVTAGNYLGGSVIDTGSSGTVLAIVQSQPHETENDPMSAVLAPDDLSQGTLVAVHSQRRQVGFIRRHGDDGIEFREAAPTAPVPTGVPLEILGISLPFVACAVIEPGGTRAGPVILDIRTVRLARLSGSFVAAVVGFEPAAAQGDEEEFDADEDVLDFASPK